MLLDFPFRGRPNGGHLKMCQLVWPKAQLFEPSEQCFHAVYAGKNQPVILGDIFQGRIQCLITGGRLDLGGRNLNHLRTHFAQRCGQPPGLLAGARGLDSPAAKRFFLICAHGCFGTSTSCSYTSFKILPPPRRSKVCGTSRPSFTPSVPSASSRSISLPSGRPTMARRYKQSLLFSAYAPIGTWQPPPIDPSSARSHSMAARVSGSSSKATSPLVDLSSRPVSIASAPWPTAGHMMSAEIRERTCVSSPKRRTPAAAKMMASYSPDSSFLILVSTLPRRGKISRSGRTDFNWHCRRKLLVPTFAPFGRSSRLENFTEINASRGSSRFMIAASSNSCSSSVGTSFRLCTARSTR